jgi:acetyl esterase/lipase
VLEARATRRARVLRAAAALTLAALAALGLLGCGGGDDGPAYAIQRDVSYGAGLMLDAYVPNDGATGRRAVLLFHGGAWRGGNRTLMEPYAIAAAERGMVAFTIGYRTNAPRVFPDQLVDGQLAVTWVRQHAAEYGLDPARVGLLGASAGAHLAALIGTAGSGPLTEGTRVKAVASWSGPMDLVALLRPDPTFPPGCGPPGCLSASDWQILLQGVVGCRLVDCIGTYVALSPVSAVTADDSPMLLVNGVDELTVPVEQAVEMRRKLRGAGVPYEMLLVPGTEHAAGYADAALQPTLDFFERRL